MVVNPVIIRIARSESERNEALKFMNEVAFKWYGCAPPAPPEIIFVAALESKIVGTMALEVGDGSRPFPAEEIYDFDRSVTPWPFERKLIAQFGRWMAEMRGISGALMYAATVHALSQGRIYGLTEVKERIKAIVEKMGWELKLIPNVKLLLEKIPEDTRGYYTDDPPPKLYMVDLEQKKKALEPAVLQAVNEKKIILAST